MTNCLTGQKQLIVMALVQNHGATFNNLTCMQMSAPKRFNNRGESSAAVRNHRWAGTYLEILPDELITRIFGPMPPRPGPISKPFESDSTMNYDDAHKDPVWDVSKRVRLVGQMRVLADHREPSHHYDRATGVPIWLSKTCPEAGYDEDDRTRASWGYLQ